MYTQQYNPNQPNGTGSKYKVTRKTVLRALIAGGISLVAAHLIVTVVCNLPIVGWIFAWMKPLLGAGKIGVAGIIAFIVGVMNIELDVTTPRAQKKLEKELDKIKTTGDTNADDVIRKGQEMIREIRECNAAIPDPQLTRQLYEVENLCIQIFKTVSDAPAKAPQIRKFMNYYLPTTLKMLNNYRTMQDRGVSQLELAEARDSLARGLNMILTACQKQLDSLYKDNMLDVNTDIDVLEQMLKRDGFAEAGSENAPQVDFGRADGKAAQTAPRSSARTAAAAQVGDSSHPTLDADLNKYDIYPHYSTHRQNRADE